MRRISDKWIKWRVVGKEEYSYLRIEDIEGDRNSPEALIKYHRAYCWNTEWRYGYEAEFVTTKEVPTGFLRRAVEEFEVFLEDKTEQIEELEKERLRFQDEINHFNGEILRREHEGA